MLVVTPLAVPAADAGLVSTAVCGFLDDEPAAPTLLATQNPMTTQITMGITTKSTKPATDTPTAMPTTLLTTVTTGRFKRQNIYIIKSYL